MGIFSFLQRRRLQQVENNRRLSLAVQAFGLVYPQRQIGWCSRPEASRIDSASIVMVCWNDSHIPPARTWWRIDPSSESATELSYEEMSEHIDMPAWR